MVVVGLGRVTGPEEEAGSWYESDLLAVDDDGEWWVVVVVWNPEPGRNGGVGGNRE